jgi:hypothetical protein
MFEFPPFSMNSILSLPTLDVGDIACGNVPFLMDCFIDVFGGGWYSR